jgi:hypothetical protein
MSKLTVMVSMYESGDWIENRLLNLLQSNTIQDMEIWCLNANSPDEKDHDIPTEMAKTHKQIKYERLPRRNTVYEAWNYIIEKSNSTYITNANTDDLVAPHCYDTLMKCLDKVGPSGGLAYCSWYTTGRPNQSWDKLCAASSDGQPGNYSGNLDTGGVGHFPLWRRSLHTEIGLFDPKLQALADADWWARIYYIAKKQLIWIHELLAVYLWRDGQNLWHRKMNREEWHRYHQKVILYKQGKLE